jgi:AcrR family transcriptional regulator
MASLPEHLMPAAERAPLPREVRLQHQRRNILDASIEVFAKRGYPATTIDHIVAAARVAYASFYEIFNGKQDCFLQCYERIVGEFWERISDAVPPSAPWLEQVCAALRATLETIAAEPLSARVALVEVQTGGPEALALYERTHDALVPLLRPGREFSPAPEALPETLEEATIGGVAWLLHQRLVGGEVGELEALHPELVEIVLGPYLGEPEAARIAAAG